MEQAAGNCSEWDRIQLRGLRVLGRHGVGPGERETPQPFEVDLDLLSDLSPAARSDGLADTVDYGVVLQKAAMVVSQQSFALLEALAEAIAAVVLSDARVVAVTVGLRKLRPPVPLDVNSVGVRITRGAGREPPSQAARSQPARSQPTQSQPARSQPTQSQPTQSQPTQR